MKVPEHQRRMPSKRWQTPLSPSEADELDEFLAAVAAAGYDTNGALWHAHIRYARQAATTLALGELWSAQRAAAISTYALALYRSRGGTEPLTWENEPGEGQVRRVGNGSF